MKSTDHFKEAIKKYLDEIAAKDENFDFVYNKPEKKLDDCIAYILNTVKESGMNGFADQEIYSMAMHYYQEDDIKVNPIPENMKVVVNHHIELTNEEKAKAREDAMKRLENEIFNKAKGIKSPVIKIEDKPKTEQRSLF